MSEQMNQALDQFCAECAEIGGDDDGDRVRAAFRALEIEAENNPHAAALMRAVLWIIAQPRTSVEKLTALRELSSLPRGFVHIPSLREFCGWRDA
jgi:hypothetical protein